MLESWLDPKRAVSPRRPTSNVSRSVISEQSNEDDEVASMHSEAFDVQPIDRISLLNKTEFQGKKWYHRQFLNTLTGRVKQRNISLN